ncbi:Pyridoxine 5'-phosphate oxidase family protein containing flavin binding domain [Methanonatronarchaeum thermophilum]|uniref:Pyridoxine 5'-phosphate oxidase family protein containing flavin binding domain n=1 Tax=Methanonatronarchaeum thermophilum TaxID=1927129 RepID=A0A1Y3GH71_9EURY|nr:pyridoxamine 5'-phosphate oxidase family protein [Methanonatronarchaeum thermophilum]OUJ18785.1 Pyridoxine 5'-phosphate oxidase family protein containing flavin binding domain [Methanonatronarchaeum thermophilum]
MAELNEKLIEFMENNPAEIATIDEDGNPHIAPKGSLITIDKETIAYAEMYPNGQTAKNIKNNGKTAISIVDYPNQKSYMIKGKTELKNKGKIYEQIVETIKQLPIDLPTPQYAGIITIKEIINHSVGPEAGKKL